MSRVELQCRGQLQEITATVITYPTLPTTVVLRLGGVKEELGQAGTEPPTDTLLWAKAYSSGPVCGDSNDITAANVRWDNIAAGFIQYWRGWLILPSAISTNDPTGIHGAVSQLLLSPDLVINDEIADPTAPLATARTSSPALTPTALTSGWRLIHQGPKHWDV